MSSNEKKDDDKNERGEKSEKDERRENNEKGENNENGERNENGKKDKRYDKNEKCKNKDKNEEEEKNDKKENYERNDKNEKAKKKENDTEDQKDAIMYDTKYEKESEDANKLNVEADYSLASLKQELTEFRTRESASVYTQEMYPGIYRSEYDYIVERHNPFATNLLEATSYLIKGCLGAGVLSMHEGFMYGGMVGSGIGAAAIGFLLSHCMSILVRSAQRMYLVIHVPRLSYPDLAEAAVATGPLKKLRKYSKYFRYFVELLLFLGMSGSCSLYEILIARTIKKVLEYLSSTVKELQMPLRAYIFIIMIPLMLLCVIRKWKYLAPFSIVADLFVAICVITTMFYSMSVAENITKRSAWKSIPGLFKFFGICMYTMDGTSVVLPVENNMRSPHHARFVVYSAMSIVIVLSTIAGFLGYWGWGEKCKSPVTIHMPLETIPIILQFLLAAMLAVTLAIQFWVPFKIIWHYIGKSCENNVERKISLERFYRMLLLFFITCISTVYPRPNNLMIFLGVIFVSISSLILPTLIETLVFWHDPNPKKTRWYLLKNVFICLLGVIIGFGGIYSLYFA